MALETIVRVRKTSGDELARQKLVILQPSHDAELEYPSYPLGTTATDIDLGPIAAVKYVFIYCTNTDRTIYVYKDRSPEYWEAGRLFVAVECNITHLALRASSSTTVYIYMAGDA